MLYGDLHVQQALALVMASEAYSEVLLLEAEPRVEGHADDDDEQPQVLQTAAPNPVLNAAIIKSKDWHVEGEVPPHFPEQASYSSHASTSLCLENQEQYTRLAHYMYSRGGYDCVPVAPDGSCLFSSLRRIISAPFEYRNIHLRRQRRNDITWCFCHVLQSGNKYPTVLFLTYCKPLGKPFYQLFYANL